MKVIVDSEGKRYICIDEFVEKLESHKKEIIKFDSEKVIDIVIRSLNRYNKSQKTQNDNSISN